jgi:hypothetical protein
MLLEALDEGAGWFVAILLGNWLGALIFFFAYPGRAAKPMALWTAGYLLTLWSLSGAR